MRGAWNIKGMLAKLPLLAMSFVMSIVLYLYVQAQSVTNSKPTRINVRVVPERIPAGLFTSEATVAIEIEGPQTRVDQIVADPSQVSAFVDLRNAVAGQGRYPLLVRTPSGITVDTAPKLLALDLQQISSRVVEVRFNIVGMLSNQSLIANSIEAKPDQVTLTGPANVLRGAKAQINCDLSMMSADFPTNLPVQVLDAKGAVTLDVTASPPTVQATPIVTVAPQHKQIYLNVAYVGSLKPGLNLESARVDPVAVSITGPGAVLAKIASADVEVNLATVDQTGSYSGHAILPAGVQFTDPKMKVKIKLVVRPSAVAPTTPAPSTSGGGLQSPP